MEAWGHAQGVGDNSVMLGAGTGDYARAMGINAADGRLARANAAREVLFLSRSSMLRMNGRTHTSTRGLVARQVTRSASREDLVGHRRHTAGAGALSVTRPAVSSSAPAPQSETIDVCGTDTWSPVATTTPSQPPCWASSTVSKSRALPARPTVFRPISGADRMRR